MEMRAGGRMMRLRVRIRRVGMRMREGEHRRRG